MATLKQAGELITTELRERVERLVSAVEDDAVDLTEIALLADAVGELADAISETYIDLEQTLMRAVHGQSGSEPQEGDSRQEQQEQGRGAQQQQQPAQNGGTAEDVSKEELLVHAREVDIPGRSSMTKEELAQAVETEESVTKEELLERARQADIEGRSTMSKQELRNALRQTGD
jgi:hypothetical protein